MHEVLIRRPAAASSIIPISVPRFSPVKSAAGEQGGPSHRPAFVVSGETVTKPLSLTRRGRFLLVGLPLALGVAVLIFLGAFLTSKAHATVGPAQSMPTVEVTIATGETLWDLAVQHAPERDPRDVVSEMVELNNLHTSVVQAGQSIAVPGRG